MVPHMTTALTGPLLDLERSLLDNQTTIEQWLRSQWLEHTPPFYASVDLRNAGFKLAPVDTNLFPGGFNNLSPALLPLCIQAAMAAIEKICPEAKNLLLIPESHTRNVFYLQNVARLAAILHHAGLNVRIGSLLAEITAPTTLELPDGHTLTLEPLRRVGPEGRRLGLDGFDPCAVLRGLNRKQRNKMSVGKEGLQVTEVMIQEGVPTVETVDDGNAEPVVYMIDRYVVGGFYRVNTARGVDENLNAPGMHFKPLAFDTYCTLPDSDLGPDAPPNRATARQTQTGAGAARDPKSPPSPGRGPGGRQSSSPAGGAYASRGGRR